MGIRIHSHLMFKYCEDLVCQWSFPTSEVFDIILRSRIYVDGNHESRTTEKENPRSQPIWNSRITAGFFLYSRITRSISVESRITENPFQTLLMNRVILITNPDLDCNFSVSFGLKSNHKGFGTSVPCVASLDSCVTYSPIRHRYLKDRTTEKREKKETVLQCNPALYHPKERTQYFLLKIIQSHPRAIKYQLIQHRNNVNHLYCELFHTVKSRL